MIGVAKGVAKLAEIKLSTLYYACSVLVSIDKSPGLVWQELCILSNTPVAKSATAEIYTTCE